jgi:hypothetical protein
MNERLLWLITRWWYHLSAAIVLGYGAAFPVENPVLWQPPSAIGWFFCGFSVAFFLMLVPDRKGV